MPVILCVIANKCQSWKGELLSFAIRQLFASSVALIFGFFSRHALLVITS